MGKWRLVDFQDSVTGKTIRRFVAPSYETAIEKALADMGYEVMEEEN